MKHLMLIMLIIVVAIVWSQDESPIVFTPVMRYDGKSAQALFHSVAWIEAWQRCSRLIPDRQDAVTTITGVTTLIVGQNVTVPETLGEDVIPAREIPAGAGTAPPIPVVCPRYQHEEILPAHCATTCEPTLSACDAICKEVSAFDGCVDDLHIVTEREWQDVMARLKTVEVQGVR